MARRSSKTPARDCNVPIASWKADGTTYEIRYTGPDQYCTARYNPKHSWGGKTPSLIVTRIGPCGIEEQELDPYDTGFWGWIVRLIADGTIDRSDWKAISKTDAQQLQENMKAYAE